MTLQEMNALHQRYDGPMPRSYGHNHTATVLLDIDRPISSAVCLAAGARRAGDWPRAQELMNRVSFLRQKSMEIRNGA